MCVYFNGYSFSSCRNILLKTTKVNLMVAQEEKSPKSVGFIWLGTRYSREPGAADIQLWMCKIFFQAIKLLLRLSNLEQVVERPPDQLLLSTSETFGLLAALETRSFKHWDSFSGDHEYP